MVFWDRTRFVILCSLLLACVVLRTKQEKTLPCFDWQHLGLIQGFTTDDVNHLLVHLVGELLWLAIQLRLPTTCCHSFTKLLASHISHSNVPGHTRKQHNDVQRHSGPYPIFADPDTQEVFGFELALITILKDAAGPSLQLQYHSVICESCVVLFCPPLSCK